MDGIPSGLSSITPILPQTLLVGDRSGLNTPPVEVLPLPVDSFGADGDTAEMRSNSYAPNLDARGAWSGDVRDAKTAGRTAAAAGQPLPDAAAGGAKFDAAYTLSLGISEDAPVPPEIARELSRAKSYELLGRTAFRQVYRRNPETGGNEQDSAESAAGKAAMPLMYRSADQGPELPGGMPGNQPPLSAVPARGIVYSVDVDTVQVTGGETETAAIESDVTGSQPSVRAGGLKLADRLTPSDYEAILSLEPELREALLGMLADDKIALTLLGQNAPSTVPAVPEPGNALEPSNAGAFILPADDAGSADAPSFRNLLTELLGKQESILSAGMPPGDGAGNMAQISDLAHGATTAAGLTSRLAAAVLATSAADGRGTAEAGMANLQKINELPYALYLFGNVPPEKRPADEEEEETLTIQPNQRLSGRTSEFLRLSEAVKMAAVLHSIYHGGSGFFPAAVPWYAPYVSYAVKHGIIRGGEFGDFNEYATRAATAYIFSGCVPKAEFRVINYAPHLVDVDEDTGYGAHIYLLCRAGVLTGGDKSGRFYPESMLTRSEAAAIIGRIATPEDRKRI